MTIAWDRQMQPIIYPEKIPESQIAVDIDFLNNFNSANGQNRRQLANQMKELVWFNDLEEDRMMRIMILEAMQVELIQDSDSDALAQAQDFAWNVIDFDKNFIHLDIKFTDPLNISFESKDYITVTFWDVELFKSYQGIEVEFGTQLNWKIQRQMTTS